MAFSFRKMFSNIVYFKRPQSDDSNDSNDSIGKKRRRSSVTDTLSAQTQFEKNELDLSTRRFASSVKRVPEPVRYFSARKSTSSETDLFNIRLNSPKDHRRNKKLRLDIERANRSADSLDNPYANQLIENTPKQISLGILPNVRNVGVDLREIEFDKSMDNIFAFSDSNSLSDELEHLDIESMSDNESDSAPEEMPDKSSIPMCRKVSEPDGENVETAVQCKVQRSVSLDSFSDVESNRNEDERITLLLSYQMKIEKLDRFLKNLLTEFQFHIEVSKVFQCKSFLTALPGSDVSHLPKILGDVTRMDVSRGVSPSGSWNIVMEKEDAETKTKLRNQLMAIKGYIEEFVDANLKINVTQPEITLEVPSGNSTMADTPLQQKNRKCIEMPKSTVVKTPKKIRINRRKYEKRMNDFPDLREILHNLYMLDGERSHQSINASVSVNNVTALISEFDESNASRCTCSCPVHKEGQDSSEKSTDSGLATKRDEKSDTICSSIGDFSLDNSQLTAYSESLEQVLSYNSFNDSTLISTMLQKSAIERITFYVQVHNIQMTSVQEEEDESMDARSISFSCQACLFRDIPDEQGLLKHILGQTHCEKLHFLYKTAYIKRCFASSVEIQPSTILNSMTMYRDENKIVCFGDSKFACSLCFENGIVGESVLMAHCYAREHMDKRNRLDEILQEGDDGE